MESLTDYLDHVKVATPGVYRVHKDECVCSFDTPESEGGLYVCMKTFEAVGRDFLDYYYKRYGYRVYLRIKRMRYRVDKPDASTDNNKPKRLAIGLEGGFDVDSANKEFRYEEITSIVIMPSHSEIALPNPDLPDLVLRSVSSILSVESAESLRENTTDVWDGEKRRTSKYADNLQQNSPAPKIPMSDWKCEQCDLTENLWLNLTDGSILCGRRFFDGSGGNNHASEHYEQCKHPLAVKLGTITENGADVYSYPEEDMVEDPYLKRHLAHFGIDTQKLTKTDKSMVELEIDINQRIGEWSVIQEEGHKLEPASGPGFTGLINLGNSCYMNSVLQVLFSLNEFQERFYPPTPVYNLCDGPPDFNHQMAKLAYGLLSGRYSEPDPFSADGKTQTGIAPKAFKHYVCGQNANFATKRQQDAQEFFLFLADLIERNNSDGRAGELYEEKKVMLNPTKAFEFVLEDRLECSQSKKVRYTHRVEYCLPLHVELERSLNPDEVEAYQKAKEEAVANNTKQPDTIVRHKIPFTSCLEQFVESEELKDFYSSAISGYTNAMKTTKISRFPRYFVFQMKKFKLGNDWVPRKLDVSFEVPDTLDLEMLTAMGLQADEEELEDTDDQTSRAAAAPSESKSDFQTDPGAMSVLLSMGIDLADATRALTACNNDPQQAIEFIFNPPSGEHSPQNQQAQQQSTGLGGAVAGSSSTSDLVAVATGPDVFKMKFFRPDLGPKKYHLKAFVSHMGTSTMCGHYVCHIKKEGRWYIFNDSKVAISENPPKELGYLYFYERANVAQSPPTS